MIRDTPEYLMLPPSQRALASSLAASWRSGSLPSGVLFHGPAGVGKGTFARAIASMVLAPADGSGHTPPLSSHPDFQDVSPEPGQESVSVDAVREAAARFRLSPAYSGFRILLIDSTSPLTPAAASAILKTLEEPPALSSVFLTVDQPSSLLPTILSRCLLSPVPKPTPSEASEVLSARLAASSIEASADLASEALRVSQSLPGRAMRLLSGPGADLWPKVSVLLASLSGEGLDRSAGLSVASLCGSADAFSSASSMVLGFLSRASAIAAGSSEGVPPDGSPEASFASKAGLRGCVRAYSMASQVRSDTQERHLDGKYAFQRMLLSMGSVLPS